MMLIESLSPEHSLDSDERETLPPLFENDHADVKGPNLNIFSDKSNSQSSFGRGYNCDSQGDTEEIREIDCTPVQSTLKKRFLGGVANRFQLETVNNKVSKEQDDEMLTDKKTVRPVKKEITAKSPRMFRSDSQSQTLSRYNLRSTKNKINSNKEQQERKVRFVLEALATKISTVFKLPHDFSRKPEEERVEILKTSLENYRAGK